MLDSPATPTLVPDFELLKKIGSGSYGEVCLARNVTGSFRAIKIVYRERFRDDRPFEREFAGIKRFEPVSRSHENFVTIFHVGRNAAANCFYYVMELADDAISGSAMTPDQYKPKTLDPKTPLSADESLRIATSLSGALVKLHQAGLIHRDIKPSNIIYVGGVPKLADIGLVAEAGESRSFVGTEGFVPPEGPGSAQADIYSLGKTLYEILTGKDRHDFPQLPSDWATRPDHQQCLELNGIILRACENDAAKRYRSAQELLSDLQMLQRGKSVQKLRNRRQIAKAIGLACACALLTLGGWKAAQVAFRGGDKKISAERQIEVLLAQAKTARSSKRFGHRAEALQAIAEAASIKPTPELRDEAIAALASLDLVAKLPSQKVPDNACSYALDRRLEHYAIGTSDGELRIGTFDGQPPQILHKSGEKPWVDLLHFSPENDFLAVRYQHLSCWIWDLKTTNVVLKTRWGTDVIKPDRAMDFSPLGNRAANAVTETVIRIFELPEWKHGPALNIKQKPTWLAFDPGGKRLAVVAGNRVEVWDTETLQLQLSFDAPAPVFCADWHPRGDVLAIGSRNNDVYLWDTISNSRRTLTGHNSLILRVAFSPDGDLLASTGQDATSCIWDVLTGQLLLRSQEGYAWDFSSDGKQFAFIRERESISRMEIAPSPILQTWDTRLQSSPKIKTVDVRNDASWFIAASDEGFTILNATNGRPVAHSSHEQTAAALLLKDNLLLTGAAEGIRRWTVETKGQETTVHKGNLIWPEPRVSVLKKQKDSLVAANESQIAVLNSADLSTVFKFSEPTLTGFSNICDVALSPNGDWLAACGWYASGTIVWNTKTKASPHVLGGRTARLEFTPDGQWLITSTADGLALWKTGDWSPGWKWERKTLPETPPPLAISADGRVIALAHNSAGTIKLFETKSGRELANLTSPIEASINDLKFSPAGDALIAATSRQTVHVWNLTRIQKELKTLGLETFD